MNDKIILFDGVCNFCNSSVNFILKRDKHRVFKFAPFQSQAAEDLLKNADERYKKMDSFIFIDEGKIYNKSTGALRVLKYLPGLWPLLYGLIIVPAFLRDPFYNLIYRKRFQWFGRQESCMIPTPEVRSRFLN